MRNPTRDGPARQAVLDAAAELQAHRSAAARRVANGAAVPGVEIYARGAQINLRMMAEARTWSHLLSVRPKTNVAELRTSLPNNRVCLAAGHRWLSAFDEDGTTPAARALLAAEEAGSYFLCHAPVQTKIVEMRRVLLQGPFVDDEPSVLIATAPAVLDCALRYWHAVMATAHPVRSDLADVTTGPFTARQATIVELMRQDLTDGRIAEALGLSVRTVRSDIAAVLRMLGAGSRFTAGARLARPPDPS